MRQLARLTSAVVAVAAIGFHAEAQTIGGGSAGGGAAGGTGGGGGGGAGGGSGLGGSSNPAGNSSQQQVQLSTVTTAPTITGVSAYSTTGTGQTNQAINSSNFLRNTYANPYYQGRSTAQANQAPGGFGTVLYTNSTGTGGNIGYSGSGSGGFTGTGTGGTSTTGGRTGSTSFGGTTSSFGVAGSSRSGSGGIVTTDVGGQIVQLPRNIAYTSTLKFSSPRPSVPQLHADIRGMLDRSTMIANPRNVDVQLDNGGVVLRGMAQDEDEARMIEGMIRLTPGVQFVRNEMNFPRP